MKDDELFSKFIPRSYEDLNRLMKKINDKYEIEISIIKDIRPYIILEELEEMANENGLENAKVMIREIRWERLAHDFTKRDFSVISKKLHELMSEGKRRRKFMGD